MQIPASALAASITSVSTGKAERVSAETPVAAQAHVESSEQSNADRDAQGQGDGIGPRGKAKHVKDAGTVAPTSVEESFSTPAPTLPDEPPSQLDMMG